MKKNTKWLVLVCSLCVLFSFPMNGFMLVQGAPIAPREAPHVVSTTAQHGVPSASLEWEANQLVDDGETCRFTGRSPVPFTSLVVGWLVDDHTAAPTASGAPAQPDICHRSPYRQQQHSSLATLVSPSLIDDFRAYH